VTPACWPIPADDQKDRSRRSSHRVADAVSRENAGAEGFLRNALPRSEQGNDRLTQPEAKPGDIGRQDLFGASQWRAYAGREKPFIKSGSRLKRESPSLRAAVGGAARDCRTEAKSTPEQNPCSMPSHRGW
jgi:hypothetical protein